MILAAAATRQAGLAVIKFRSYESTAQTNSHRFGKFGGSGRHFVCRFDRFGDDATAPQFSRTHEKLPAVFVETGNMVYCRMRFCDFRFPLPDNARVVWTNIDSGGFDTINGSVFIQGTNGGSADLRHYAEFLLQKKWEVSVASGLGCPDVTNNRPDEPFVSPRGVTHYPLFEGFGASSSKETGGGIQVETTNGMTQIHFSYFGDY